MYQWDDNWRDVRTGCNLPTDFMTEQEIATLSSEVTVYSITGDGGETDERAISR